MAYIELDGNPSFFEKMIGGFHQTEDFLHLHPGEAITQSLYF
jgi:hypothetical protein